jgi:CheY-like chemotaxis protein
MIAPPRSLDIVVADDNRDTALTLAVLLQRGGHRVVSAAHNGRAALAAIEAYRPSVAILDIVLPELDGYEIARYLRSRMQPRPRLIAISGLSRACDRLDAIEAGFQAHFVKPVEWERLRVLLHDFALLRDLDAAADPRD